LKAPKFEEKEGSAKDFEKSLSSEVAAEKW